MSRLLRALVATAFGGAAFAALHTLAQKKAAQRERIDPARDGVPGAIVEIDGEPIHYVERGEGDAVVLLHGWNGSTFSMRYAIAELAERYRVVAVDLPGYGYSTRAEHLDYTSSRQAAVVLALMDKLGIDRAVVLGHSMGGGVAMRLALADPDRVPKLVLVASVTPRELHRAQRLGRGARLLVPLAGLALIRESIVRRILRRIVHDPAVVTEDMVEGYFRPLIVKGHLRSQAKQMKDRAREESYHPGAIRQPVLIMHGEHDRVIPPETGSELAQQIPAAEISVIRSAGHLPLEEQAAECNNILLQFLARPEHEAPGTSNGAVREGAYPIS